MSVVLEILDKLVYLTNQKIVLTLKLKLKDLQVDLRVFYDYVNNIELNDINSSLIVNELSFWYNEEYDTYTICFSIENKEYHGNVCKSELISFLSSLSNDVMKSNVNLNNINIYNR